MIVTLQDFFERRRLYTIPIYVTRHPDLLSYISTTLLSLRPWILSNELNQVIIAWTKGTDRTPIGRHVFSVALTNTPLTDTTRNALETHLAGHLARILETPWSSVKSGEDGGDEEEMEWRFICKTSGVKVGDNGWIGADGSERMEFETDAAIRPVKDAMDEGVIHVASWTEREKKSATQ